MMPVTPLLSINYPSENSDPFFMEFQQMLLEIEEKIYGLMSSASNILITPPTISYNTGLGLLTWDDDFLIQILNTGFFLRVQFGPDLATRQIALNEGDRVVVEVPLSSSQEVTGNFRAINGVFPKSANLFTLGMRRNNKFYANLPTVLG
jgi:hypothetical protein